VPSQHECSQPASESNVTVAENDGAFVETTETQVTGTTARAPICPEGEKLKCTLGPPPVCHCE
jgi:hypothetical protein